MKTELESDRGGVNMLGEIATAVGSVAQSAAQSEIGNRLITKATEFVDEKFRDPKLISKIEDLLRSKFGEEPFYNDFDAYITENNTLNSVFDMFYNIGKSNVLSKRSFVEKNLTDFSIKYPQYGTYDVSTVKQCFEIIYAEIYSVLISINPHTYEGKLQISGAIYAEQSHREHDEISAKLDLLISQNSTIAVNKKELNEITRLDIGDTSEIIKLFLKDIDSVGCGSKPTSNDLDAIDQYQKLLSDVPIVLRGQDEKQIDLVICSLEAHLAIRYSNLGNIAEAFNCLDKVPKGVAESSKLYHFVYAAIIVGHCIEDKYTDAEFSIKKALEFDNKYHRAFLIAQLLAAMQKSDTKENILNRLDSRFLPILAENKDTDLLADYYMYRGFVCKEFNEYDTAEHDFVSAKKLGYDELVADYNIGLSYYSKATAGLPHNERLFCVQVDIILMHRIISLYKEWLFGAKGKDMPLYIKSRMVGIYASCCGLLNIKHELTPIKEYISLPQLEYEALRTIILGYNGIIDEELLEFLNPDDQLFARLANLVNYDKYNDCKLILDKITDDEARKMPVTTVYLILQACVANRDIKTYQKFRVHIFEKDEIGLIDCIDAYVLEQKGEVEEAKNIIDKYAYTSVEYGLLRNIVGFYIRNNYHNEASNLFLRVFTLSTEKQLHIEDKFDFCKNAILYFMEQHSMTAKQFVDALDMDSVNSWRLKASFYDSICDIENLLVALDWLCENEYEYSFGLNKTLCLFKLMRYEEALPEAMKLLATIDENNIKDRTNVIWLISNIYLFMGKNAESVDWARKAHEITIDIPSDRSHQAYFARALFADVCGDPLSDLLEYKKKHPVVINEWLKEIQISKDASGEEFIKTIDKITGQSHEEYERQEKDFVKYYKDHAWCPNFLVFKHYGSDYGRFFEFAKKHKLRISSGVWNHLYETAKTAKDNVCIDSLTLVVLQQYGCLDALRNVSNIHICYSTIQVLQNDYQSHNNARDASEILAWLKKADNVVLEPDGYKIESSLSPLFSDEYLICCKCACRNNIPLLTIEPSIEELVVIFNEESLKSIKAVSVVSICFATMSKFPDRLSDMLYTLLGNCTFINFTAETIFERIKSNNYIVDKDTLSRFFICNSSCDMMSFEKVYICVIRNLLAKNKVNEAIVFASLVLDDSLKIWRKGFHYRYLEKHFQDQDAIKRHAVIVAYLISIIRDIWESFDSNIPEQLQGQYRSLQSNIVDEFGEEFIRKMLKSDKIIDS